LTDKNALITTEESALLGPEEQRALQKFRAEGGHSLSPTASAGFLALFIQGKSLREIHDLNRAIPFGSIVEARLRYGWDSTKEQYIQDLQSGVVKRMIQAQMESVNFLADVMAATHKKYGGAIKKYLQSGNKDDLEGFDIESISSYQKVIDSVLKITGKDKESKIRIDGSGFGSAPAPQNTAKGVSPEKAKAILKILANGVVTAPEDEDSGD